MVTVTRRTSLTRKGIASPVRIGTGDHYAYAGEDGALCRGWKQIDGSWYHFNADGIAQTGWQEIDGSRYFFNPKGVMRTGWVHDGMGTLLARQRRRNDQGLAEDQRLLVLVPR